MRGGLPNPKELGFYFALAQGGLEMVAPIGVGVLIDWYFDTMPWATIVAGAFGFVGGLTHMVMLVNRHDRGSPPRPPEGEAR